MHALLVAYVLPAEVDDDGLATLMADRDDVFRTLLGRDEDSSGFDLEESTRELVWLFDEESDAWTSYDNVEWLEDEDVYATVEEVREDVEEA